MTEQWAQPTPGQTVRVTTRFPEINYWATTKWKDTTYEGVVGRADRSVPQGSFMLLTPHTPEMPTRVIALGRVIRLEYADGSAAAKRASSEARRTPEISVTVAWRAEMLEKKEPNKLLTGILIPGKIFFKNA